MNLTKSFLWGACLSFSGLLLFSEILLRLSVPTGFWYRHFDFSGDMTSLAELRDRIDYAAPPDSRVVLLGDSVLGASSLVEHRISQAREKTLFCFLRKEMEGTGLHPLSLGSDGMLLPDIEGLVHETQTRPPQSVLLLLNFRMFSRDFADGPKALSRDFLLADLPGDVQKRLAADPPPSEESRLSDRLYAGLCDHWFLFRQTQMAKTLWYYPSQDDFFQRQLEHVLPPNEILTEITEASLKQKVAPYYQAYPWDKNGLPLTCLKRILDEWTEAHIPVAVVLTPQNQKFLGNYLDKPSFEKNRKTLAAFLKPYGARGVVYEDWSGKYPASSFLDHCHLTPEGNRQYAHDLARIPSKAGP